MLRTLKFLFRDKASVAFAGLELSALVRLTLNSQSSDCLLSQIKDIHAFITHAHKIKSKILKIDFQI